MKGGCCEVCFKQCHAKTPPPFFSTKYAPQKITKKGGTKIINYDLIKFVKVIENTEQENLSDHSPVHKKALFYSPCTEQYYLYSYVYKEEDPVLNETMIFPCDESGLNFDPSPLAERQGYVHSREMLAAMCVNLKLEMRREQQSRRKRREKYTAEKVIADIESESGKYKFDKKEWLDEVLKAMNKEQEKDYKNYALEA